MFELDLLNCTALRTGDVLSSIEIPGSSESCRSICLRKWEREIVCLSLSLDPCPTNLDFPPLGRRRRQNSDVVDDGYDENDDDITQVKVSRSINDFMIYLFRSVTDPRDGKRVALKKMPNVFQSLVSSKRVFRELKMLCFFKHDNVRLLDRF